MILKDTHFYLKNLIVHCKEVYLAGPPETSLEELYHKKIAVYEHLVDLKGNSNFEDKAIIGNDLLTSFFEFYLHYHRSWCTHGKYLLRQMKFINNELFAEVFKAYYNLYNTQTSHELTGLLEAQMNSYGNIKSGFSSSSGLIAVKKNYIVLQFTNIQNYYTFIQQDYVRIKDYFKQEIHLSFAFLSGPIGNTTLAQKSLYIFMQSTDSGFINQQMMPLLQSTILNKYNTHETPVKCIYPVNIDFSMSLGGDEWKDYFFKVTDYLSNKIVSRICNEKESMIASIEFIKIINTLFFHDTKSCVYFWEFVENSWLSRSYDTGRVFGIEQIIAAREKVKNQFLSHFKIHQKQFSAIYFSETSIYFDQAFSLELNQIKKRISKKIHGIDTKPFQVHPMLEINNSKYKPDVKWAVLRNFIDICFATFLIDEPKRSYISFVINHLLKPEHL